MPNHPLAREKTQICRDAFQRLRRAYSGMPEEHTKAKKALSKELGYFEKKRPLHVPHRISRKGIRRGIQNSRGGLSHRHRRASEAIRDALIGPWRKHNYRFALLHHIRAFRGLLGRSHPLAPSYLVHPRRTDTLQLKETLPGPADGESPHGFVPDLALQQC